MDTPHANLQRSELSARLVGIHAGMRRNAARMGANAVLMAMSQQVELLRRGTGPEDRVWFSREVQRLRDEAWAIVARR